MAEVVTPPNSTASAAPAAPDLGALSTPGTASPITAAAPAASVPAATPAATAPADPSAAGASNFAAAQQATQNATQLANQPVTPGSVPGVATGPHARLLNMIQGLALGADAFGKAIATHGKEGGVEEVQQANAQKQQMQIQAQQAAQAKRDAQLNTQYKIADTNIRVGQMAQFMAKFPSELQASQSAASESLIKLYDELGVPRSFSVPYVLGQSTSDHVSAVGQAAAQSGGLSKNLVTTAHDSTGGGYGTGDGHTVGHPASGLLQTVIPADDPRAKQTLALYQSQLNAYKEELGDDNPQVQAAQSQLDHFKSNSGAGMNLLDFGVGLQQMMILPAQQVAQKQAVAEFKQKQAAAQAEQETVAANSPVAKLSTPEALAAPGAQAAIQAKIDDPNTAPADIPRLRNLIPQAAAAQFNAQNIKTREERQQQLISQGDPDAAGKLLASRAMTIDELKLRNATPEFMESAVMAAQKYDPTFKAAEASAQAKIAGSEANAQFFGNVNSLIVKDGTLDQLQLAGTNLGNGKYPAYNSIDQWRKAAVGQGAPAAYAAAVVGVSDDYAKVMGGSQGSDKSRQQVVDIVNKAQSPEQRTAAINQIRQQVESQRLGRVGTNPYLNDMYPDPVVTRGPNASTKFQSDSQQPARPSGVPANYMHGSGPHGSGWYDPTVFGGK